MAGVTAILLILVVGATAPLVWRRCRSPRPPDPRRELSTLALHTARGIREGISVPDALGRAAGRCEGPVGEGARAAVARAGRGVPLADALAGWADDAAGPRRPRVDPDDLDLVVAATTFGGRTGGDVAAALEGVSVTLLDRAELDDETRALTSQARASAVVLCTLPVLGVAVFALVEPRVAATLVTTSVGRLCVVGAVVLDLAAVAVSRALASRVLR